MVVRTHVAVHHTRHHAAVGTGNGLLEGGQTVFPDGEDIAVGDLGDFKVIHDVVGRHRHIVNAPVVVTVCVACFRGLTVRKTQVDRIHVGSHTAHVQAHRKRIGRGRVGGLNEGSVRVKRRPRRHAIFRGSDLQVHGSIRETAIAEVRLPAHNHRRVVREIQGGARQGTVGVLIAIRDGRVVEVAVKNHPAIACRCRRQGADVGAEFSAWVCRSRGAAVGVHALSAGHNPCPKAVIRVVFHRPSTVAVGSVEPIGERFLEEDGTAATDTFKRRHACSAGGIRFLHGRGHGLHGLVKLNGLLGESCRRAERKPCQESQIFHV